MGDPISVRQVMASVEITERITKADAATQQALGEEFAKELDKKEALKQARVVKKDENEKIRDGKGGSRENEEQKREASAEKSESEDTGEVAPPESEHIIDLQV